MKWNITPKKVEDFYQTLRKECKDAVARRKAFSPQEMLDIWQIRKPVPLDASAFWRNSKTKRKWKGFGILDYSPICKLVYSVVPLVFLMFSLQLGKKKESNELQESDYDSGPDTSIYNTPNKEDNKDNDNREWRKIECFNWPITNFSNGFLRLIKNFCNPCL
jgi:hypothetical protein